MLDTGGRASAGAEAVVTVSRLDQTRSLEIPACTNSVIGFTCGND